MKLLKGKRLQPDLPVDDQPFLWGGALVHGQASIGFGGQTKALGTWLPPGSVIARAGIWLAGTEDRALARMLA